MPRGIPNQAKNNPVLSTQTIESAEQPLGHTIRVGGGVGEPKMIQVADRMPDPEKAAMLAFMNEMVTIRPATSTDKNAEQVFELTINNRTELFRRGEQKTVRRCYVDLLARLKVTAYTQREVTDSAGVRQILNDPHTALKYDFAMVEDKNPMGESWLKTTLAMAG
jgi:hypothetical protein